MTIDPLGKAKRVKRAHKGHTPVFIGGRVCTVHCECGWGSGQHLNAMSAWAAFSAHEKHLDQEKSA